MRQGDQFIYEESKWTVMDVRDDGIIIAHTENADRPVRAFNISMILYDRVNRSDRLLYDISTAQHCLPMELQHRIDLMLDEDLII